MTTAPEQSKFIEARIKAKNALTDLVILASNPKTNKNEIYGKSQEVVSAIADMTIAEIDMKKAGFS